MKRDGRTVTKVLIRDIAFTRGEKWPGLAFTVVSLSLVPHSKGGKLTYKFF